MYISMYVYTVSMYVYIYLCIYKIHNNAYILFWNLAVVYHDISELRMRSVWAVSLALNLL